MIPKSADNSALADLLIFVEKIFATHIPDDDAKHLGGPGGAEHWLELHLSNQRPNWHATTLLRKLAEAQQRTELAEGLDETWRREQIGAIIGDIFCKRDRMKSLPEFAEFIWLYPPQGLVTHPTTLGRLITCWRELLPKKASNVLFVVLATLILLYRQFLR